MDTCGLLFSRQLQSEFFAKKLTKLIIMIVKKAIPTRSSKKSNWVHKSKKESLSFFTFKSWDTQHESDRLNLERTLPKH